ncbi:MAG TPA: DUF1579 family protein [Candidatus Binatia bacterium]|nr:DUF1579 family protein [Candidatus Binatia bacterium]
MDEEAERAIAHANEIFEKDVGTWDAESVIRPGPEASPVPAKGVARNRRIAGGRYLVMDYASDSGFEGHGIYGWDPARGRYTGVWVDSTSSAIARSEGTWDPATRTMTYETVVDLGTRSVRYREITQTQEDGSLLYRNLVPLPQGGEFEMVRVVYRRRA